MVPLELRERTGTQLKGVQGEKRTQKKTEAWWFLAIDV